jgi:hypothetical protein
MEQQHGVQKNPASYESLNVALMMKMLPAIYSTLAITVKWITSDSSSFPSFGYYFQIDSCVVPSERRIPSEQTQT